MVLALFDYTSILIVLNNFIKKRFATKSSDERSDFSIRTANFNFI